MSTEQEFFSKKTFSATEARRVSEIAKIEIEKTRQKTIAKQTDELTASVWSSIKSSVANGKWNVEVSTKDRHDKKMEPEAVQNVAADLQRQGFSVYAREESAVISISW